MKLTLTLMLLFLTGLLLVSRVSLSDSDDDNDHHEYKFWQKKPGVKPVSNSLYQDECGSCHFAYQAGLLPSQSWQKIMATLDDHFGDNAELDAADSTIISQYLEKYSAEKSDYRRSVKLARSSKKSQFPIRITEIPYFVHEHDEIPSRLVKNNPKVVSLSQCDKCHQTAEKGSFSEREILIPGYGKWDD
ncbi:MAG: diheme cytochrome c [Gammaproteobacteria bacterium]